jgi:hypothetical protein
MLTGLLSRHETEVLARFVPAEARGVTFTTYGKGAFELAVIDAGLIGKRLLLPAYISHDFVGVFRRHAITPVFADVDPETVHLDAGLCTPELLSSVDGVVLLHTFGLPADGLTFRALTNEHGLVLIEDCARALGARRDGVLAGGFGDYAAFSLSKVAPVRRGGLLLSPQPVETALPRAKLDWDGLAHSALLVRIPGGRVLEGPLIRLLRETPAYPGEIGLYKAPKLQSLEPSARFVFDAFLPHYAEALAAKKKRALELRARLSPLGFRFQTDDGSHIHTAVGARVPPGVDRDRLRDHLRSKAINVFTLWGDPLGTSRLAAESWGTDPGAFPITAALSREYLHFPTSRFMTESDLERIVAATSGFLGHSG